MSEWTHCTKCGNTHENMTDCPKPTIRMSDDEAAAVSTGFEKSVRAEQDRRDEHGTVVQWEARARKAEAELYKARNAVKRLLVTYRDRLFGNWYEITANDCGLLLDSIGFIKDPKEPGDEAPPPTVDTSLDQLKGAIKDLTDLHGVKTLRCNLEIVLPAKAEKIAVDMQIPTAPQLQFCSTGTIAHGVPVVTATTIVLNGQRHVVCSDKMSYQEIVDLAATRWGRKARHSITYFQPAQVMGEKQEGFVDPGQSIRIMPGTRICAVVTGDA